MMMASICFNYLLARWIERCRDNKTKTKAILILDVALNLGILMIFKYLNFITLKHLFAKGVNYIVLTTDEWRKGAVKSYLSGGFLPVEYDTGMEERWAAVLEEYGIDSVQMLNEDATPYKIIYRSGLQK